MADEVNNSGFQFVSIGYVAKDILEDDLYIDVLPIELQPSHEGEISESDVQKKDLVTPEGNQEKLQVKTSSMIKAKWLPMGTGNRLDPPTVCKGETVMLYKFNTADKYFWTTMYNELHMRKNEKCTMVYSNKKEVGGTMADLSKVYYTVIDTINKFLHIGTAKNDGEYTNYDFDLNTKKGLGSIIDGKGNFIELDSVKDSLTIHTNKRIDTKTTDVKHEIGNTKKEIIGTDYNIELKTFGVTNNKDELMALIVELIQANIDVMHVGNLGINTAISAPSEAKYKDIQSRVKAFIK